MPLRAPSDRVPCADPILAAIPPRQVAAVAGRNSHQHASSVGTRSACAGAAEAETGVVEQVTAPQTQPPVNACGKSFVFLSLYSPESPVNKKLPQSETNWNRNMLRCSKSLNILWRKAFALMLNSRRRKMNESSATSESSRLDTGKYTTKCS
eukprot:18181_1